MMRRVTGVLTMVALLSATGCRKADSESTPEEADMLYRESKNLIIHYTNVLKNAKDSTDFDSISDEFEEKYSKLNMSVAAGTDLLLTEERNDTLALLMARYVAMRNKRLGGAPGYEPDSVIAPPPAAFVKSNRQQRRKAAEAASGDAPASEADAPVQAPMAPAELPVTAPTPPAPPAQ